MSTFWDTTLLVMDTKHISRADLARFLSKEQSVISQWIKFDRVPTADYALKIAKFLKVDIEYLITGKSLSNEENEIKEILKNPELKKTIAIMQNLSEEDLSKFRAAFEAIAALSAAGDQPLGQGNAG